MRCKNTYASEEAYKEAKKSQSKRYRARTGSGQYWNHWTHDELREVMKHEQSDRELSERIHHSVSTIQAARRRVRMGLVSIPGYDPSMDALASLSKLTEERSDS